MRECLRLGPFDNIRFSDLVIEESRKRFPEAHKTGTMEVDVSLSDPNEIDNYRVSLTVGFIDKNGVYVRLSEGAHPHWISLKTWTEELFRPYQESGRLHRELKRLHRNGLRGSVRCGQEVIHYPNGHRP